MFSAKILTIVIMAVALVASQAQPASESTESSSLTKTKPLAPKCGHFPNRPDIEPYIRQKMDGSVTAFGSVPWHAGIFHKPSNALICSGVLISSRHVLTSGLCPKVFPIDKNIEIRLGDWDIKDNRTRYPEQEVFVSRTIQTVINYPETTNYDAPIVALLKMNQPVDFRVSGFIAPICLPTFKQLLRATSKRQCFVSGWGYKPSKETREEIFNRKVLRSMLEDPNRPYGQGDDFYLMAGFYHPLAYYYFSKPVDDPYSNIPSVNIASLVTRKTLDAMASQMGVVTAPWVGLYLDVPSLDEQPGEKRPRKYETIEDFNPPLDSFPFTDNITHIIAPAVQKILDYYPKPTVPISEVGDVRLFNIYWEDPEPKPRQSNRRYSDFDAQDMFPWPDSILDFARGEGKLYRQKEKYREGGYRLDSTEVIRIRSSQELAIRQLKNYIRAKVVERLMPIGFRPRRFPSNPKIDFNKDGTNPYLKWQDVNMKETCPNFPRNKAEIAAMGKSCIVPVPRDESLAKDICLADLGSPIVCRDLDETPYDKYAMTAEDPDSDGWLWKWNRSGPAYLAGIVAWKRPCYITYDEPKGGLNLTLIAKTNETLIGFLEHYAGLN